MMDVVSDRFNDELNLQKAAGLAWAQAVKDFYYPPLPEPLIENSPTSSNFFYIDSETWTVHLNVAGVPVHLTDQEMADYLVSVCHHEIQHYLLCPFDGVMNGRMFAAARQHVNDSTAMFVCNLFADLVIDSNLLRRFSSITHNRINSSIHDSSLRSQDHSDLWKLIVTCYRVMWGFPIPSSVKVEERTFEVAQEIIETTRPAISQEHRWPKVCGKIAKILSEWMPAEDDLPGVSSGVMKEVQHETLDGTQRVTAIPLDVDGLMGNPLEARNGDLARRCLERENEPEIEQDMERLAIDVEQLGGNIEELQGVYLAAGIGSERAAWTRFWYRAKAYGAIRFEVDSARTTESILLSPEVWRLGDPLEELDIVQSLQAFPVLIPNRSTRKWSRVDSIGLKDSKFPPDMLIVLDSSGSMTWSMRPTTISGDFHTALVAAFAAMDFALRRGCKVAAINFSDGIQTCDWSKEKSNIERVLLAYQGGGTVAPIRRITEICESSESDIIVLLITDAEVSNWKQMVKAVETLSKRGHRLFLFHIGASSGSRNSKMHKILVNAGATVYPIKSVKQLPGLVVREMKRVYND